MGAWLPTASSVPSGVSARSFQPGPIVLHRRTSLSDAKFHSYTSPAVVVAIAVRPSGVATTDLTSVPHELV